MCLCIHFALSPQPDRGKLDKALKVQVRGSLPDTLQRRKPTHDRWLKIMQSLCSAVLDWQFYERLLVLVKRECERA